MTGLAALAFPCLGRVTSDSLLIHDKLEIKQRVINAANGCFLVCCTKVVGSEASSEGKGKKARSAGGSGHVPTRTPPKWSLSSRAFNTTMKGGNIGTAMLP